MEDQLEYAMDLALKNGASYAEARYQSDISESTLLKNGIPEVSAFETRKGIGIRVLVDGALGFGATDMLSKREVGAVVKRTLKAAKASARMRRTPISMAKADLGQAKIETKARIKFENVGMEQRIDLLKEADAAMAAACEMTGAKMVGRYFSMDTWMTEKIVMSSDGARVYSTTPRVAMDAFMTAFEPSKGPIQRIVSFGESCAWEAAERWDLPRTLGEEASTLGRVLMQGAAMKEDVYDVVLGPDVVGIISHESSGHPAEADRVLGREAAQAGETYLGKDAAGHKVGSGVVNVVDDPTLERSFGRYDYDDEGVRSRRRYLIKNGMITEFLHNRSTAAELGAQSNASARSVAYNREPIVRMANTFVEPGDHSLDELVEGVQKGIYIKNFMEWNIDDRRYNQKYVGLEAYIVENGRLKGLVRDPNLEITTPALWSAVDAVGKDLKFSSAYCGKGDPMQGIPVWTGGPSIRLRGIRLGVRA
jgi:TldD protein